MRPGRKGLLVWDLPTRLFHWLTVVLLATLYITERLGWMDWHIWAGEVLLALVLFRLIWGFIGGETARFTHFLATPVAAIRHLSRSFRRTPDTRLGHNPSGGWMILFMLALLLIQCLSGIYVNNDVADEGYWTRIVPAPVSNAISDSHAWVWDVLLGTIIVHLTFIGIYTFRKRHNLLVPMLTGRKQLPATVAPPRTASFTRALLALLVASAITYGITWVL